jgi:hypothetical protein
MTKTARARYTLEFKLEAVRLVEGGQSIAAAARTRWAWSSRHCSIGSRSSARASSPVLTARR